MRSDLSRRSLLTAFVIAAGGTIAGGRRAGAVPPPEETGLSSEGLLAGHPGFQPRTAMPLPHPELPGFLSREQLARHHAEYVHAVEALRQAEQALGHAVDARRYGELRRQQVAAGNSVLLHELYFGGLAPAKVEVGRYLDGHMREHMGSVESWTADFTRCALAAKSWAVLVYDPYDDRWHDVVMDGDGEDVWVGANPLVVCDVSEHAFEGRREDYVAKFLDHIDWEEIARRYRAVDRK